MAVEVTLTPDEVRERARARVAARRARLRADPVVWAAHRERENARLRDLDKKRREDPAEREKDAARLRDLRRRKKAGLPVASVGRPKIDG